MESTDRIVREALIWSRYVRTCSPRFDVNRMVNESLKFCSDARTYTYAIYTSLTETQKENVKIAQCSLDAQSRKLFASIVNDRIVIHYGMYPLGRVQKKHNCWLRPLVESGSVLFWLHSFSDEKSKSCGVNIIIYNLSEAIQRYASQMKPEQFTRFIIEDKA